ncbi:uncharacterized protein LOC108879547 [Lates calcarifer]|uniref:Uncharacterized protein LOC108879547 n=1 Tax=Lates calcarifer TaxID=8187 RepID=A0AAJ7LM97_LATCA|nr:uncharacterized protein LOC108879547 [Lates calcarifer]
MAFGCVLWVSWICFLLFDGSDGLPAIKGYGYPYTSDLRNLGDDGEDEVLTSPTSERPVNGDLRDWGLENPAKPQPGLIKPQSTSLDVASLNSMDTSPSTSGAGHYAQAISSYKPASSSQSQAANSPGSSAHGGDSHNIPRLVFEQVFQYPSENKDPAPSSNDGASNTAGDYSLAHGMSEGSSSENASESSFPSYPANAGAQPVFTSGERSSSSLNFGQTSYWPHNDKTTSWLPQEPVSTQKVVSPWVSKPLLPPTPPPSYIIQSRNGYQRDSEVSKGL